MRSAPFLARVRPFTMPSPAQFRPQGPPPLGSERYVADYLEVKELGGKHSTRRTPEQTATAVFWEPSAVTVFRFANADGATMGRQIALQILRDFFAPVNPAGR